MTSAMSRSICMRAMMVGLASFHLLKIDIVLSTEHWAQSHFAHCQWLQMEYFFAVTINRNFYDRRWAVNFTLISILKVWPSINYSTRDTNSQHNSHFQHAHTDCIPSTKLQTLHNGTKANTQTLANVKIKNGKRKNEIKTTLFRLHCKFVFVFV